MERVRAAESEQAIIGLLTQLGLSLEDLRGQGYDGASTMGGEKSGVQKKVLISSQRRTLTVLVIPSTLS